MMKQKWDLTCIYPRRKVEIIDEHNKNLWQNPYPNMERQLISLWENPKPNSLSWKEQLIKTYDKNPNPNPWKEEFIKT